MYLSFCSRCLLLNSSSKFLRSFAAFQLSRRFGSVPGKMEPKHHRSNDLFESKKCSITVIGTGGNNIFPSLFVQCHGKAYMFNCGEGTFRDITRLNRNPVLFATKGSWENIGGVVELSYAVGLGCSRGDRVSITCSVPSNIDHMFTEGLSRITGRDTWSLRKDTTYFQDDNITIRGTEIKIPGNHECVLAYSCKQRESSRDVNWSDMLNNLDHQSSLNSKKNSDVVVKNHASSGTRTDSLEEKGQRRAKNGSIFMVIECPNERFAGEICKHPHLNPQWFADNDETVDLIVHMTPLEVLQTKDYCSWMAGFNDEVHHLLLHSSVCPGEILWRKSMLLSKIFNSLNPKVYRVPCVHEQEAADVTKMEIRKHLSSNQITLGSTGLKLDLYKNRPLMIDNSGALGPFNEWFQDSLHEIEKFCNSSFERYHKLVEVKKGDVQRNLITRKESVPPLDCDNDFMVTFLGTGAKMSSPFRNTAGILVETLRDGNLLLDCGESTLKQFYSCFGKDGARKILSNIHNIFISHLHPDHYIGLFSLLSEIFEANGNARINLIGPAALELHLRLYGKCHPELDYNFLNAKMGLFDPFVHQSLCMKTIPVKHVRECYGIKITTSTNKSIVYSGDTQPCSKLIDEGRNTDLLIHEATHQSLYYKPTQHSTYAEAVEVSKAMNASFTILTHFSRPYSLKVLFELSHPRIIPAVDFMSVRLSDITDQRLDSKECHFANKAIALSLL